MYNRHVRRRILDKRTRKVCEIERSVRCAFYIKFWLKFCWYTIWRLEIWRLCFAWRGERWRRRFGKILLLLYNEIHTLTHTHKHTYYTYTYYMCERALASRLRDDWSRTGSKVHHVKAIRTVPRVSFHAAAQSAPFGSFVPWEGWMSLDVYTREDETHVVVVVGRCWLKKKKIPRTIAERRWWSAREREKDETKNK